MATLKDIAKLCGVSITTVSYVLNNSDRKVLPATRVRVLDAMAQLNYQPNAHARALKGVRTPVVGVVFPHPTLPFRNVYFGPILEGIVSVATDRKIATMLFTGFTWEETENGAQRLFSGICDGFILVAPRRDSQFAHDALLRGIPLVTVGSDPVDPHAVVVDANNRQGGRLATEHLLALGHRRIAMVLGAEPPNASGVIDLEASATSSLERQEGYLEALRAYGVTPDPALTTTIGNEADSARDSISRLLQDHKPTAVFGFNDGAAYRTIEACKELGLRVPEDLSVIGFDDIASSETYDPPLTTIRQPIQQIGSKSIEVLCDQISGKNLRGQRFLMDVQLIERRSTAPI